MTDSATRLAPVAPPVPVSDGVGASAARPDGGPKVRGEFAFTNDMWAEGMLWGATLRSPHPSARVRSIDTSRAAAIPGVVAVLRAPDVPGELYYGLDTADQPVLAHEVVRYVGEPVAVVAADHPETARRALAAIEVDYLPLAAVVDPAEASDAPALHPDGNLYRHLVVRRGDPDVTGPLVVEGTYEVGMQDQAFMGPESALAIPASDGGVDLFVATQWLHSDRGQVARALGLPEEKVRLTMGGVGGAFGAREDVSLQIHVALLARATNRPVKMTYSREESFLGHVHRHPARMWYRHTADADGHLLKVEASILMDGGAYRSTSFHVLANAVCFSTGPYRVGSAHIEGRAVRTNNPPCGAMRGFGAVQVCFGHEAQMDQLARLAGIDPVEIRLRNALAPGDAMITGQRITGALPVARVVRETAALPLPAGEGGDGPYLARPGGSGRTTDGRHVRRGIGFAVGIKNLLYAEGFPDESHATVTLAGDCATVRSAAAEVGQGWVALAQQIARTVIGVERVVVAPADTLGGSAGSSSASRQSWMSGGAVAAAAEEVRQRLVQSLSRITGVDAGSLDVRGGMVTGPGWREPLSVLAGDLWIEETAVFRHRPTVPLDGQGQGDAHVSFVCAAHRAVVDVDVELGLVKVVRIDTAQDVGRVLNPLSVQGQIEGGIAQGVGLAVMEELVLDGGRIRNPSFTDYLIPTALDMPEVRYRLIEEPEPGAPFGAKGVGEAPTISSTAAVAAAIRQATGLALARVPIRPEDIALAGR
ncbi:MAG: xanthine dehydrogenase subunit D [Acidobacteriota bacterium]|nr:xanthine dehydrogenase subunit D [Acidobacteriota bacterium]